MRRGGPPRPRCAKGGAGPAGLGKPLRSIVTLAAALIGGALATALGVPAGPLVGGAVAATLVVAGGRGGAVPIALRDLAFSAIGVTLGAGIGPDVLSDLARWPLSLGALAVAVALIMAASGRLLGRLGMERGTAMLAVSPGALSLALSLSEETGRDTRSVSILQAVRLLTVTVALPPVLSLMGQSGAPAPQAAAAADTGYGAGLVLLGLTFLAGRLGGRLGVPAAMLLAGVTVSGAAHVSGLVVGRLPAPVTFVGFAVAGAVIGARFEGVTRREILRTGRLGLVLTAVAVAIAAAAAWAVSWALALPFGQVMVAFAPGGVEAMASMALFLGHDPVYVGTHHIARILGLALVLPWFVPRSGRGP